ncbi:Uncharacterized protein Adt_04129 [Abeliophyllum distichum]|uniref:Uncharacterized protein n=1 Tax=Abeliophyllum distichum TaxID=126358 RepID=A0ABD1W0G7_9LAMI
MEWVAYSENEKFQVRHNADNTPTYCRHQSKDLYISFFAVNRDLLLPCDCINSFLGLAVIYYVYDIYKKETYLRTYTSSISFITGPKSWPNPSLNPFTLQVYTKKYWRPKKARRKELNEESSPS